MMESINNNTSVQESPKTRYERLENAAPAHTAHAAAIASILRNLGDGISVYPEDPNQASFDVNINDFRDPTTGKIDLARYLDQAIRLPLYYLFVEDPTNPNASVDLMQAIGQIGSIWNELSPDQQAQVTAFLGTPLTSGQASFATIAANLLAGMEYFFAPAIPGETKEQQTIDFLNQCASELKPLINTCPWIKSIYDAIDATATNFDLDWMPTYGQMDSSDFTQVVGFQMEQIVLNSGLMDQLFNGMRHEQSDDAVKKAAGNVFLLYILLIMILFGENDDLQMQETGGSKLVKLLGDRSNDANQMLQIWNTGNFTAASAQKLISQLQQTQFDWKDGRLAQTYGTVNGAANQLLDPTNSVQIPTAISGYAANTPLGQIISDAEQSGNWQPVADALNVCQSYPDSGSSPEPKPNVVPPVKNTITLAFQQIQTSAGQQSNAASQQLQSVEGTTEKDQTMLSSALDVWIQINKYIMTIMSGSSS